MKGSDESKDDFIIQKCYGPEGYEYIKDIGATHIHAWGHSLDITFAMATIAVFGLFSKKMSKNTTVSFYIQCQDDDNKSLFDKYIDEVIALHHRNPNFVCTKTVITFEEQQLKASLDGYFEDSVGNGSLKTLFYDEQRSNLTKEGSSYVLHFYLSM